MTKKMIAKSLICTGFITFITQANAAATGFYGGASFGGAALTGDSKLNLSRTDPAFGILDRRLLSLDLMGKNIAADLFAGYGQCFNGVYVGIEAIGSLTPLKSKKIMDISGPAGEAGETLAVKTNNALGISANIGYHINPSSKLYIKAGLESRRFNFDFISPANAGPFININKSYRSTSFVPGLGLEVDVTNHFSIRTEYRAALYPKKNFQVNDSADATRFTIATIKPVLHYFNVGLVFKI